MATKLMKDGYGQVELNHVAFRRDGRVEAQSKLDETDFADMPAENGMLLVVDFSERRVKLPTAALLDANMPVALHYSTEKLYDQRAPQLKNFKLELGDAMPRLGYLAVGDKFTTNTVTLDFGTEGDDAEAGVAALEGLADAPVYGGVVEGSDGYIVLAAATTNFHDNGPLFKVVEYTTMPDGQPAVKLQVLKA